MSDEYHSQFAIEFDKYRDNNNFLRYNNVEYKDNRYNFLENEKESQFIDMILGPTWISNALYYDRRITRDGVNFFYEEQNQLLGTYYFYGVEMLEHSRSARNFIDVLSDWGGLQQIVVTLFGVFVYGINEKFKKAKFIRSFYFLKSSKNPQNKVNIWFSVSDKLSHFKNKMCCGKLTK